MTEMFDPETKKTGLAHFGAATRYSLGGLKTLLKESAFRQEILCAAVALVIYVAIGASTPLIMLAAILILLTFAVEAINTAIELVIDRTSPEISDYGRNAKDLGSFAVMCLLIANGIFALYVISVTIW
jgi:diacylglycerol kinase (ATP)